MVVSMFLLGQGGLAVNELTRLSICAMTNTMNPVFYARPGRDVRRVSINLKVWINGTWAMIGAVPSLYTQLTGIRLPKSIMIDAVYWDAQDERVRKACPHASLLNKAIDKCRERLTKLYQQHEGFDLLMDAGKVKTLFVSQGDIKPTLLTLLQIYLDHKRAVRANENSIQTYEYKFRPLRAFLIDAKRTGLLAEHFEPPLMEQYRTYLIAKRNNQARAADKACQVIKTVLIWALDSGVIGVNPLANKRIRVDKTPNIVYLTQDEVAQLKVAALEPKLRRIADCFIFSCYTGIAYTDMKNLTPANVRLVDGVWCIASTRQKTGTGYCVPISHHVQALLDKYGTDLPLPSNKTYNIDLKLIMALIGIDKLVSSHVGRKTFIDWYVNVLGLTVESAVVAMGQKNPSELKPYLRLREQLVTKQFPRDQLAKPVGDKPFQQSL